MVNKSVRHKINILRQMLSCIIANTYSGGKNPIYNKNRISRIK